MSPRNTGHGSRRSVRTVGVFEEQRRRGGAFDVSPKPHERQALAAAAVLLIAAVLALLAGHLVTLLDPMPPAEGVEWGTR